MKITNEVLEGYLNCKTKGHLKLAGEHGTPADSEEMTTAASRTKPVLILRSLKARDSSISALGKTRTCGTGTLTRTGCSR